MERQSLLLYRFSITIRDFIVHVFEEEEEVVDLVRLLAVLRLQPYRTNFMYGFYGREVLCVRVAQWSPEDASSAGQARSEKHSRLSRADSEQFEEAYWVVPELER